MTIKLVHPSEGGKSVTKSIVNSLPILSGIGSDRKNPAFASRQTVVLPQISQFRISCRTDSLNLARTIGVRSYQPLCLFPGDLLSDYHVIVALFWFLEAHN